jgi:hypothetical protein
MGFLAIIVVLGFSGEEAGAGTEPCNSLCERLCVSSVAIELDGKVAKDLEVWAQLRYVDKYAFSLSGELAS